VIRQSPRSKRSRRVVNPTRCAVTLFPIMLHTIGCDR
jgi:hypothetical protein